MFGHDPNSIRSRYDYYYSVSTPSLSQATSFYETQASLFGESVPALLPAPNRRSPSPSRILTPLTPFNTHNASTPSSATNFASPRPLLESFDHHLYESFRKNFLDKQNSNPSIEDPFNRHQIWTTHSHLQHSSSISPRDDIDSDDIDKGFFEMKRPKTSFGRFKSDGDLMQNKYRSSMSAHESHSYLNHHDSPTIASSDITENQNPSTVFYLNNKPDSCKRLETTSNSTSACSKPPLPSKFIRSKTTSRIPARRGSTLNFLRPKKKPVVTPMKPPVSRTIKSQCTKNSINNNKKPPLPPVKLVKSKSDMHSLKTYPDSFTVLPSPKKSPSAGANVKRRRTLGGCQDDDDDSILDSDWIKPPVEKLYEVSSLRKPERPTELLEVECKDEEIIEECRKDVCEETMEVETKYTIDHYGQKVSMPTTPIITERIMTGSRNRVPDGSFNTHKKIAFAVINDYKARKTHYLQKRHSDDDITGRLSPYSRYVMQRELSMPALNKIESLEMESDDGEFFYVMNDDYDEEGGRKTSIGFVHSKRPISSSMSELEMPKRPHSEMKKMNKKERHYQSIPNFVNLNKQAVRKAVPIEKTKPRVVFHRCLRGILKVYDNTNVQTKRQFSLDNMDIFLPNGKVDPDLLAPMPIRVPEKRSMLFQKREEMYRKKRLAALRKRRLSPIQGTPHKENYNINVSINDPFADRPPLSPKRKIITPKDRLAARLKKDRFGRLITPKKDPLPDFRNRRKKPIVQEESLDEVRLPEDPNDKKEDDEHDLKAMNFMKQLQAKNVLGKSFRAKLDAKNANKPPLERKNSKISIDSFGMQEKPPLKKKASVSSMTSIRSVSKSLKSFTSFSQKSSGPSIDDEESERKDKIGSLDGRGSAKSKASFLKKAKGIGLTSRLGSAASKTTKESSVPPPSRQNSKLSLLSRSNSKMQLDEEDTPQPIVTPSRKSEPIRAPSASSIMSMTTAAITSNPLNATLIITNQLSDGNPKTPSKPTTMTTTAEVTREEIAAAVASHPDADKTSMASQHTSVSMSSKTSAKGSRKTSGKTSGKSSRKTSAEPRQKSGFLGAMTSLKAVTLFKRRGSNNSATSEKSDEQLTTGQGSGADNQSQLNQSMESTMEKKLEKKISKKSLMDQDANNNNVGKMSRTSTRSDMKVGASMTRMESVGHMSSAKSTRGGDQMSVNAITVAPDARSAALQNQESDDNQSNSSTSSSMAEMSRKRKLCCGLSACCNRSESQDALQKLAKKTNDKEMTFKEKLSNCACWPFRICKRQKVADGKGGKKPMMMDEKPSFWKRICCCSSCCRSDEQNNMKGSGMKESCWSRFFKNCSPCCASLSCSSCCRPKDDSPRARDNDSPGTCTRIFCFCCLCCRGKPESEQQQTLKRPSQQSHKGNCCSRMCNALLCCRRKKRDPRRTSMLSKKQSLAPTIPPPEEQKPKLDMVLVEHASLMKGAIPVLPLYLAYFCLIANVVTPGLGTILSGLFCLCIGIPRFSQHDGARGRIGSFIINLIVGVSQCFTIIFCFVGWGWSIWWGTIMVNLAKKRRRIKKAEALREEDEYMRQKEELPGIGRAKTKDVEKGII